MTSGETKTIEVGKLTEAEARLIERVEALWETQLQWTRDLIAIPTVNPFSRDDSAGIESAGQDWIEDRFKEMGGSIQRIAVPDDIYDQAGVVGPQDRWWKDRENVVSKWSFGSGGGTTVLINDHMDTVGASNMTIDPYDPIVKDGLLFGRGSTDTKGNMVVGLAAMSALLQDTASLSGNVVFESVVDEECDGAGSGTLACCLAGITGDVALCLDGGAGAIHNQCNGIVTGHLTVHGKGGHSSIGASANAIDLGILAKQAVDKFGSAYKEKHPQCATNVGVFKSGSTAGTVPQIAELMFNMSYDVSDAAKAEKESGTWDGGAIRAQIEQQLAALGEVNGQFKQTPIDVRWIKDMYPFKSDLSGKLGQLVVQAAADAKGEVVPVKPMPAWFDASHLSRRLGIPTLGIGSGTPGKPHSADETAKLEDLKTGAKIVALALHRLLSK